MADFLPFSKHQHQHRTHPLMLFVVTNPRLHPSPSSSSNLGLNAALSLSNKHADGIEPRLTVCSCTDCVLPPEIEKHKECNNCEALIDFRPFSHDNSCFETCTTFMATPKSPVRPFTAGNFDSTLPGAEGQFSAHTEEQTPPTQSKSFKLWEETKQI